MACSRAAVVRASLTDGVAVVVLCVVVVELPLCVGELEPLLWVVLDCDEEEDAVEVCELV
ncbi:MAG: hypothetical protein WAU69_11475 [Solirubrobacteraceae bacterium]